MIKVSGKPLVADNYAWWLDSRPFDIDYCPCGCGLGTMDGVLYWHGLEVTEDVAELFRDTMALRT